MNKKGQIAGQIFIYIMAAIIIGGIVLIGYSAINSITKKSCDAEKISFKTDLDTNIEKYTSYGSVHAKVMPAPCDYDKICFVDAGSIGKIGGITCPYTIISDSANNGVQENIFIVSGSTVAGIGYNQLISLSKADASDPDCLCISKRNNNFYITFNGRGSSVEIAAG
jgi:hypothetical protein